MKTAPQAEPTRRPCKLSQESVDPEWHIISCGMRLLANVHIETGNAMDEANARLLCAAWNAFQSAAERLNVSPLELAERLESGGIAEFVIALRQAVYVCNLSLSCHDDEDDEQSCAEIPRGCIDDMEAALAKMKGRT